MASLTYGAVFLRLGAAVAVGALIGLDRELRRKPAGLRTLAHNIPARHARRYRFTRKNKLRDQSVTLAPRDAI